MATSKQKARDAHKQRGARTAREQREIQRKLDNGKVKSGNRAATRKRAVQAGERREPTSFREQHLAKPGRQHRLDPVPNDDAPYYEDSNKLKGKVALITGGDSGIGRAVAVPFARECADVAISFLGEKGDAQAVAADVKREGRRCLAVQVAVKDRVLCKQAVAQTVQVLGRLDVLVNNTACQAHCKPCGAIHAGECRDKT